jgi:ferredoxin
MSVINKIFGSILGAGAGRKPSLDGMLANFDQELENLNILVPPALESLPRTPFDSPTLTFGQMYMSRLTVGQMLSLMQVMVPLRLQMRYSANLYSRKFQPKNSEVGPGFLTALEKMAHAAGAVDIKYVQVPRSAIFQHKGIPYENAVVITVEMDKSNISKAPSFETMREVAKGYGSLARIGNKLARFMRSSGFAAYPGTALGGLTDYTVLAELAGLGAIGYHGLLITPNEGARLRINTIYTNVTNMPVEANNEYLWVRDFCSMCQKCIRSCPVDAIFNHPRPRRGGGMQCIEHDTCRDYFHTNFGCAICVAECPFSQVGYEAIKTRYKGKRKDPAALQLPEKML